MMGTLPKSETDNSQPGSQLAMSEVTASDSKRTTFDVGAESLAPVRRNQESLPVKLPALGASEDVVPGPFNRQRVSVSDLKSAIHHQAHASQKFIATLQSRSAAVSETLGAVKS
jgi:hypothetical protein